MGRLLGIAQNVDQKTDAQKTDAQKTDSPQQTKREKRGKAESGAALLDNVDTLRAQLERLHLLIIRLRCEAPAHGTRPQALAYVSQQIQKLALQSEEIGGTAEGWSDPADYFADGDQIAALRAALAEVEAGPYPVTLPDGCSASAEGITVPADFNLLASGRLLNGRLA